VLGENQSIFNNWSLKMNAQQAFAKARALWGREAYVEDNKRDSSPAIRAQGEADEKRLKTLLAERLKANAPTEEIKDLRRQHSRARSASYNRRFTVGTVNNMAGFGMLFVHGRGDSWADAFKEAAEFDERMKRQEEDRKRKKEQRARGDTPAGNLSKA
jgi:hypothetical protein